MRIFTKILGSLILLAVAFPLWLIGFEQIRRYGIIGTFNPIAEAFGLPLLPLAIVTLTILIIGCSVFSWYALQIIRVLSATKSKEGEGE